MVDSDKVAGGLNVEEFLRQCQTSGDAAYNAFKVLLEMLESPATRTDARVFLTALQKRFGHSKDASARCFDVYHFRIHDVLLSDDRELQERGKMTMLEIPSIFIPEDWSFTFYEGINRHPNDIFKDKTVAELGCGNGWISIALAEKWSPSKVYGLDINPRAVKVAWINLYLNALDENGSFICDSEGKTLLDRVEFHESDLLAYCRDNRIELDRIVGCIPQILNPNPEAMSKMITENASEEFLYSLSNYCALQGFVEDQFGLGLIARAVEEGIAVIKPLGIMVFNIGGRPGQGVCKRLFERRGFRITKLWQTKVIQAADTDISALVEIEKNSHHRFEFFMGLVGNQPICARTAWAFGKSGGPISHALSVYSCQLRQPSQVKVIFDFIKNGFQEISNSLDLSFEDDSVADEKIPFLAYLAKILKENSFFPYEPPSGSTQFRKFIASFMRTYHHVPLNINNVVIFPSRTAAIEVALRLFSPRLAIVDQYLTKHLPKKWLTSLMIKGTNCVADGNHEEDVITVIEAPRQSDLLIELIKKLKPQIVITGMEEFEVVTSTAFEQLLDTTRETGSRLFVDISDHLELSSLPGSNGVLKYVAGNVLPSHAAIFCGLLKNQVYSDLEVGFVICEEESIFSALSKTVELLEGHTALFSQYYYGCLFHELLSFQLADRRPVVQREQKNSPTTMIGFTKSAITAFNDAELSVNRTKEAQLIHMDVDHSSLPIPLAIKGAIFESFARQNMTELETDVSEEIQLFIRQNYGFVMHNSSELVYGDSPLALFNKLILCCNEEGGTLCFPACCNGNYMSAAKFVKANFATIPTTKESGFKLSDGILTNFLGTVEKPWVYICGPTVSPTGSIYRNEEMKGILSVCARFGARVVIDTSFSGLEFNTGNMDKWNLEDILMELKEHDPHFSVCLLGGLSSVMLSGGLDLGFLIINDPFLIEVLHSFPGLSKPHSTMRYAIKKLLSMRCRKQTSFSEAISELKAILKARVIRLKEVGFSSCASVAFSSA
ncbi:unnamed protein product [Victoria cruziana]